MHKYFAMLLFLTCAHTASAETMTFDGVSREYILNRAPATGQAPLIVALHGAGGNAKQLRRNSGLAQAANKTGVTVVFADGVNKRWNDGRVKSGNDADDVGFLTALVNKLVADGIADPNRIVFTGMSNGGIMSFTMACNSSLAIYAIAHVSANMPSGLDCARSKSRLLNIVGTEDKFVPIEGGTVAGRLKRGQVQSAADSLNSFLTASNCNGKTVVDLPNVAADGMTSTLTAGKNCDRAPIAQIVVNGGGHTWAGVHGPLEFLTGKPTMDFSATNMIVKLASGR